MALFGIGANPTLEFKIDGLDTRKHVSIKDKDGKVTKLPLYLQDDDISGTIDINVGKSKRLEHQGIRIEIVGRIECYFDAKQSSDFMSMSRELEPQGVLTDDKNYKFTFNKFEKQYESYSGTGFRLRYFLRITIKRSFNTITKEFDFAVHLPTIEPEENKNIKMEVGIEECLHIEFEYNKGKYHLKDCVIGKVYFLLVRIKIKYMELAIIRRETIGSGATSQTENETVGKFEVMDGCPSKVGEVVPIRLYLAAYELTPSFKNINNKYSVKYFLNLVLVDEEDRRYFKQQEITLWRKTQK